jgi:hypothetical protein
VNCTTCNFPFAPHELKNEKCFNCVQKEFDALKLNNEKLRTALEGIINSAVHPDVAVRSIMVPLDPIRKILKETA